MNWTDGVAAAETGMGEPSMNRGLVMTASGAGFSTVERAGKRGYRALPPQEGRR